MTNKFRNEISSFRRKQAEKSLYAFAKYYLPHHLKLNPSDAHQEIYALLTEIMVQRGKKVAIAAPRGFGKSTLVTLFCVIYGVCYLKEPYIMILSDTASQAELILENIKKELTENEKLRMDFPEVFEKNGRPKPPRWSQDQIETLNGVKIQALGRGQKPRGRKHGIYRPTFVIADDVETMDNVATEQSRDKTKNWYTNTVLMLGDENTNYVFLGTLYHPLCLLGEYLSPNFNLEWVKKTYKVILSDSKHPELWAQWSDIYNNRKEHNGKRGLVGAKNFYTDHKELMDEGVVLLWSEKWSYYDLKILLEENSLSFYCELQNEPYDPKTAIYNIDKFHYIEKQYGSIAAFLAERQAWLEFYIGCDPCMGMSVTKGDYAAIIVMARDRETNILYIIEADIRRISPQETITRIVDLCSAYKPVTCFIETNNFQKLMQDNLESELYSRSIYTPVQGITNGSNSNKANRIHALEPLINKGMIWFSLSFKKLLDQFRSFPNGQHDDGPDTVELMASNIQSLPTGNNGISCIKMGSIQSNVLNGVPDLRPDSFPHVHNNRENPLWFIK